MPQPAAANSASAAPPRPIFFGRGGSLFGVWRGGPKAREVWILVPPWAEEDKSARRTLTEGALHLASQDAAVFLFNPRGQGDSRGDFSSVGLSDWLDDLRAAIAHARAAYPNAPLCALGVRGGALLLLELARRLEEAGDWRASQAEPLFERVVLIEPILQGKRVLSELQARRKLRASLTQQEAQAASGLALQAGAGVPQALDESASDSRAGSRAPQVLAGDEDAIDFDGWAWGARLRQDVQGWSADKVSSAQLKRLARWVQALQVGPREAVLPALAQWCEQRAVGAQALRAQPFWNLLDHNGSQALWQIVAPDERLPAPPAAFERVSAEAEGAEEEALSWRNESGQSLAGVLHHAAQAASTGSAPAASAQADSSRGTVVLLHGWSGYKSGPHQMLARAARFFAARGFDVLRFDFAGRGDSDGEAELATLATMAQDTRLVLQWCRERKLQGELGSELQGEPSRGKLVLIGLCSGCEVAVAAVDQGVDGLGLWSAPIFAAQASAARDNRKRLHHLASYARKLLRPQTYRKLWRGEVDAKSVVAVAKARGGESRNLESGEPGQLPRGWRAQVLARLASWLGQRRPLLLIYGTADPTASEALAWYREQSQAAPSARLVEGANHSYYGLAWEREVFEATAKWLDELD